MPALAKPRSPIGDRNIGDSAPIGHFPGPTYQQDGKALCGKTLKGVDVPYEAEICLVCLDRWEHDY